MQSVHLLRDSTSSQQAHINHIGTVQPIDIVVLISHQINWYHRFYSSPTLYTQQTIKNMQFSTINYCVSWLIYMIFIPLETGRKLADFDPEETENYKPN